MLTFTTRPFEAADAELYVGLAASAFAEAPEHARPKDTPELVAHLHGDLNPAGRAFVTIARDDDRVVGHTSGIPFRFTRLDGTAARGWQIGCLVVAPGQQRRGIGGGMMSDLQKGIERAHPGDFVYAYPNARSFGALIKLGAHPITRAPARLVAPTLGAGSRDLVDEAGGRWTTELVSGDEALRTLDRTLPERARRGAFVRDQAFFRWRFLGESIRGRYRFARVERRDGGDTHVLALGAHTVRGVAFTILVDACPDVLPERLSLAVLAARRAGGGRPTYLTSSARWTGAPLAVAVPRRLDPRPVVGMLMPGHEALTDDFRAAPSLTGDWMGF